MNQRILVTGASGFLGRAVSAEVARQGMTAVGLGRRDKPCAFVGEWHSQDPFDVTAPLPEVDACIHLAWPTTGAYITSPDNTYIGAASLRLVQRLRENGCAHIVAAGTCAEYTSTLRCPIQENAPTANENEYSTAKNWLLTALQGYTTEHAGLTVAWARIFQVYGPGERNQRLLPHLAQLWQNGTVFQAASCTQVRDYLHVTDVASALVMLTVSRASGIYNICSGQPIQLRELILLFGSFFPSGPLVQFGAKPERAGWEPVEIYGCNTRLRGAGWRQAIPLRDGLAAYAQFLQENSQRIYHESTAQAPH